MSSGSTAETVTDGLDLRGRRFLVTGASSGLGLELARVLALRGASLVLPVRNLDKGRGALAGVGLNDDARGRCELLAADLSQLDSVRGVSSSLVRDRRPFDGLALNAGVFGLPFELTPDGLERTIASNFAGHFVLLHGLLQHRLIAPKARVMATLSESARLYPWLSPDPRLLTDAAANEKRFGSVSSPTAKVMLSLCLFHLTNLVVGTWAEGIDFYGVDPGPTLTDNINQGGRVGRALGRAFGRLVMKPVQRGAAVLAWSLTMPALPGGRGFAYFTNKLAAVGVPRRWQNAELAEQIWRGSEEHLSTGTLELGDGAHSPTAA